MFATQKGRSKPVRISCRRSEKVIVFSARVARAPASLRIGERLPDFFGGQSCHTEDLPATGLAGRYGNGGTRNLQKICQEFDTGRVGAAV